MILIIETIIRLIIGAEFLVVIASLIYGFKPMTYKSYFENVYDGFVIGNMLIGMISGITIIILTFIWIVCPYLFVM